MRVEAPHFQCIYLEGTDSIVCLFRDPDTKNKPTQAFIAHHQIGKVTYNECVLPNPPAIGTHLRCRPGVDMYVSVQDAQNAVPSQNTPEFRKDVYSTLVTQQQQCSHYKDR